MSKGLKNELSQRIGYRFSKALGHIGGGDFGPVTLASVGPVAAVQQVHEAPEAAHIRADLRKVVVVRFRFEPWIMVDSEKDYFVLPPTSAT